MRLGARCGREMQFNYYGPPQSRVREVRVPQLAKSRGILLYSCKYEMAHPDCWRDRAAGGVGGRHRGHAAARSSRHPQSPVPRCARRAFRGIDGPPDWRTGVKSFGVLPEQDGRKHWWEQDTHGQKITYELVEAKPPERLVTRIAD